MILLRCRILSNLLSSASTPLGSFSLHTSTTRFLSAVAQPVSLTPFAVEDYLVSTCGLTRTQALKASKKLAHLSTPYNPDAVLAFLADAGVPGTAVAPLVARDPEFLCASVDKILAPNVVDLTGLGLSPSEVARIIPLAPRYFRRRSIGSKLQPYVPLFGSSDKLLLALKRSSGLLRHDFERVVKPNVDLLRECGLSACEIAKLFLGEVRLINTKQERLSEMVACAEGLGVPRGSGMFRRAMQAVAGLNKDTIAARLENLKKTFGWSDALVAAIVTKAPQVIKVSPDKLRRVSEFLISEVGLEPASIALYAPVFTCSLEKVLRPRYYVVQFLKANGLLKPNQSYYAALQRSENAFVQTFIRRHEAAAPCLAQDYAAARRGEVPTKF